MPRTIPSVRTAANRLIRHLLVSLLQQASCAALVCLNVINTGDKQWELDRSYFYVTGSARLGRRPGRLAQPNWEALLPSLHAGRCPVLRGTGPVPGSLSPTAASRTLVCPAIDPLGVLVGAVFIVFDGRNGAPRGADLRHLANAAARVGGQIAAVLDLAGRVRARVPQMEAA